MSRLLRSRDWQRVRAPSCRTGLRPPLPQRTREQPLRSSRLTPRRIDDGHAELDAAPGESGQATAFVSHAWSYPFDWLISALEEAGLPNHRGDAAEKLRLGRPVLRHLIKARTLVAKSLAASNATILPAGSVLDASRAQEQEQPEEPSAAAG